MTQLPNGNLMLNMRHQNAKTLGRGVAFSADNGETWSVTPSLPRARAPARLLLCPHTPRCVPRRAIPRCEPHQGVLCLASALAAV